MGVMDAISRILAALADSIGWLAGRTRPARLRGYADSTADLLNKTPAESPAHELLQLHLDDLVRRLVVAEQTALQRERDATGVILGLLMLGGFGYWTYDLATSRGWWSWFALLTGLSAFVGLVGLMTEMVGRHPETDGEVTTDLPGDTAEAVAPDATPGTQIAAD